MKLGIIILLLVACEPVNNPANEILLWTNSPNPFQDSTKVRFYNPEYQFIAVFITDGDEAFAETIHSGYTVEGNYEYWVGGNYLSNVYYLRLIANDIKRITMLKN